MKTWVRKSLKVGVLSAGILLFAGSAAQAGTSSDNDGVLTGNQLDLSVDAPINICGNAVGVLGDATASCTTNGSGGGATEAGDWTSTGNDGVGTGNQIAVPIHTPINICGNAVGVLGDAGASCEINGEAAGAGNSYAAGHSQSTESATASDNDGVLTGNQVAAIVSVPVNVCGNAVGAGGDATASCAVNGGGGGAMEAGDSTSTGNDGVLTGNQVAAILSVPVNVCGNALALLGDATASCMTNGDGTGGGAGNDDYSTKARHGQHARKMHRESLPVVGDAASLGSLTKVLGGQREAGLARTESADSSDNDGVGVGNQITAAVHLPVTLAGNAIGAAGDAVAAATA